MKMNLREFKIGDFIEPLIFLALFLAFAPLWPKVNGVLCFGSSKLLSLMCVLDYSQEML